MDPYSLHIHHFSVISSAPWAESSKNALAENIFSKNIQEVWGVRRSTINDLPLSFITDSLLSTHALTSSWEGSPLLLLASRLAQDLIFVMSVRSIVLGSILSSTLNNVSRREPLFYRRRSDQQAFPLRNDVHPTHELANSSFHPPSAPTVVRRNATPSNLISSPTPLPLPSSADLERTASLSASRRPAIEASDPARPSLLESIRNAKEIKPQAEYITSPTNEQHLINDVERARQEWANTRLR